MSIVLCPDHEGVWSGHETSVSIVLCPDHEGVWSGHETSVSIVSCPDHEGVWSGHETIECEYSLVPRPRGGAVWARD